MPDEERGRDRLPFDHLPRAKEISLTHVLDLVRLEIVIVDIFRGASDAF